MKTFAILFTFLLLFSTVLPSVAQENGVSCPPVYVLPEKAMKNIPDGAVRETIDEQGWAPSYYGNGITGFQREIDSTETRAFKGICVVNSPLKTVYNVIADVNSHNEWVKFCRSSVIVSTAPPCDSIQYYSFDIPWPFADRDMVVKTRTEADWKKGIITITANALDASEIPIKKGCIRMTDSSQQWILEQITPSSTRVTFKSYTPLKISAPGFIKNLISNIVPLSTLKSVRQISKNQYMGSKGRVVANSAPDSRAPSAKSLLN